MQPKIPKFKRIGQSGELAVSSLLVLFANVMRPEYDVGLDFYCELFENGVPSGQTFSVQAKATQKNIENWSERIDKKIIGLWLRESSPAFIIIVEEKSETFYWISVEDNRELWLFKLQKRGKTIKIIANPSQKLEKKSDNVKFIEKIKSDAILVDAIHGIPNMIGDGYVRRIPILSLSPFARAAICHRIRLGFNYLMGDSWRKKDINTAYGLAKLLADFDRAHYDHFLFLARICKQLGKIEEAEKNYDLAIDICKADPNWNKMKKSSDPCIEDIIKNIQNEKQFLKENKSD